MVYITQLIYIRPGEEKKFDEFEAVAIPLISKYNGRMLFRMRPTENSFLQTDIEQPYEVHLVEFSSEDDFRNFMNDEERKRFVHLKEQAIRTTWLFKGTKM